MLRFGSLEGLPPCSRPRGERPPRALRNAFLFLVDPRLFPSVAQVRRPGVSGASRWGL